MKVDKETILRVASNAKIRLTEEEVKEFVKEFSEILQAFSQIDEINTKNTEPSYQPVLLRNALREDKAEPCLTQEQALSNAKHKKDGYFKGPRII